MWLKSSVLYFSDSLWGDLMSNKLSVEDKLVSERSYADKVARKILCVGNGSCPVAKKDPQKIFETSMAISALRCILSYVVFPIITPIIGVSTGAAPIIGIPIAILALYFDVMGIRRFWIANHHLRWPISFIYLAVIGLVASLLITDIRSIF